MNLWTSDSAFFAHWLGRQPEASILPNQVGVTTHILERLDNGDLISVLYHAKGDLAVRALDELKKRYEGERYALDEMNRTQYPEDEDATTDWG